MEKQINFEKEILEAMHKWGFKTEGMQKLSIEASVGQATSVKVEYTVPPKFQ